MVKKLQKPQKWPEDISNERLINVRYIWKITQKHFDQAPRFSHTSYRSGNAKNLESRILIKVNILPKSAKIANFGSCWKNLDHRTIKGSNIGTQIPWWNKTVYPIRSQNSAFLLFLVAYKFITYPMDNIHSTFILIL